jgi:hypothetical protein
MKRVAFAILSVLVLGSVGWGQVCWPPPPCCPPPPACPPPVREPSCFEGFWLGEGIFIELVVPQAGSCDCRGGVTTRITGWRVEEFLGGVVYEHVYARPALATTAIVWNQTTAGGVQVPLGFYRIVVSTTDRGDAWTYIRLVDRADCRSPFCRRPAKPCGIPICGIYLDLSPMPVRRPCCDPCCPPPSITPGCGS